MSSGARRSFRMRVVLKEVKLIRSKGRSIPSIRRHCTCDVSRTRHDRQSDRLIDLLTDKAD